MKKVIILSMLVAFVFSVSAQSFLTPQKTNLRFEGSKLTTIPYTQLKQNKNLYEGWIFPSDVAFNLNSGVDDFYGLYGQTLWPDSTVVTVQEGEISYVWEHSIGYLFDARSLGLDENLTTAPVTGPYKVDSIALGAIYEVRNGVYDTLLIEVGVVDAANNTALQQLQFTGTDTSFATLKTTVNATQQFGVGCEWTNPNKTVFKYVLSDLDSTGTANLIKYINIPLPSTLTVGLDQVLGVNITYVPGTIAAIGDTIHVYGTDAIQPTKHNAFRYAMLGAEDAYGFAFYDPFGSNMFHRCLTYNRYKTWTSIGFPTLYNQMMYPGLGEGSLIAFKVVEPQSIASNNSLQVNAYPNPAQNILNVDLTSNATATVSIVNLVGQTVKSVNVNQLKNTINISDLSAGMYMLKVTQDGKVYTNKFVVK